MCMKCEQIKIENSEIKTCAFTGHRELKKDFDISALEKEIKNAYNLGARIFLSGMALGFDLVSAKCVLELKKKYSEVKLIACIPFYNQEKSFSDEDKKEYAEILQSADEQILLSEKYYRGCLHVRNKYMADRADMLITYCKKDTGGTAWTVKYFQKKYPLLKVVFL